MSRATKRKHVLNEALQDYFTPPTEEQEIVRITASRGNNLHEVETSQHGTYLVSMPTKFRKNIWVKRGDFVIVEPIKEGDKVKAEMVRVLSKEHIKYFKKIKAWPEGFNTRFDGDTSGDELRRNMNNLVCDSDSSTTCTDSSEESDYSTSSWSGVSSPEQQ